MKVEILNILKYEDKERKGNFNTRIGYRLLDKECICESDKFKGYAELSIYIDGTKAFDTLSKECCGIALDFVLEEKINPINPLKKSVILKQIILNDKVLYEN